MKISPEIMNEMFDFSKNSAYELRCGNCLSIDPLSILRKWKITIKITKFLRTNSVMKKRGVYDSTTIVILYSVTFIIIICALLIRYHIVI